MSWCWEKPEWPKFQFEINKLQSLEGDFLKQSGTCLGAYTHITDEEKIQLRIELLSEEAHKTSKIEGELLDRDSIQVSLCRHFGLSADNRRIPLKEQGVALLMSELYQHYADPLSTQNLYHWHSVLMKGRDDIAFVGQYRQQILPTQVVSGPMHEPKVHYEAPPSHRVSKEMKAFIKWFNQSAPGGKEALPALTRAGLAHFYFVMIHPFEDGNGRIARALAEKALAQNLQTPTLIALSYTIDKYRKTYYENLASSNQSCRLDDWLLYFAKTVLSAQEMTLRRIEFVIDKNKLLQKLGDTINVRQQKVLDRMFREGVEGFQGGLSAQNYIAISKTTKATATRDLQDLVDKGALFKQGKLRYTRYFLNLPCLIKN